MGSFNGATASEPWNLTSQGYTWAAFPFASMGPRHLSRGILLAVLVALPMVVAASMGPRHLSRGITGYAASPARQARASMGPRHLSRGILWISQSRGRWCASFNGATASEPWNPPRFAGDTRPAHPCFNGATASEPWNPSAFRRAKSFRVCFNGATASEPWNPLRAPARR